MTARISPTSQGADAAEVLAAVARIEATLDRIIARLGVSA